MAVVSFPPIRSENAKILILGSMPGEASLRQGQYYAHPRNAFWQVMASICGFVPEADYAQQVRALQNCAISLWDVLASCEREGSLDSSIDPHTEIPNEIKGLLLSQPAIEDIFFNGRKAESLFRKHILPTLAPEDVSRLHLHRLPSTSPTNARLTIEEKASFWQRQISPCLQSGNDE